LLAGFGIVCLARRVFDGSIATRACNRPYSLNFDHLLCSQYLAQGVPTGMTLAAKHFVGRRSNVRIRSFQQLVRFQQPDDPNKNAAVSERIPAAWKGLAVGQSFGRPIGFRNPAAIETAEQFHLDGAEQQSHGSSLQPVSPGPESGNISGAQQDFAQIQQALQNQTSQTQGHHHHHHHDAAGSGGSAITQIFDQLGQALHRYS
jgi:hypothetical protein